MPWSATCASSVAARARSSSEHVDVEDQCDDDDVNGHPGEDDDVEQALLREFHELCIWLPVDPVNDRWRHEGETMSKDAQAGETGLLAWAGPALFSVVTVAVFAFFIWFL